MGEGECEGLVGWGGVSTSVAGSDLVEVSEGGESDSGSVLVVSMITRCHLNALFSNVGKSALLIGMIQVL